MNDDIRDAWTKRAEELLALEQRRRQQGNPKARRREEGKFQDQIIELAERSGWWVHHTPDVPRVRGGHTGKGFPDLVLLRGNVVLFVELKSATGRVSERQEDWLAGLAACGLQVAVWKPAMWEEIESILTRRAA